MLAILRFIAVYRRSKRSTFTLTQFIHAAWQCASPTEKVGLTHAIPDDACPVPPLHADDAPGRPVRPTLIDPQRVAQRSLGTTTGRAALLHAIAHIEFNAINLALDAALRFPEMPPNFTADWIRVAKEEATHFTLLQTHLRDHYDVSYGAFDAHDGLWLMAKRTSGDVLARMALVPRVLEARGLDVTPGLIQKLTQAGDTRAAEILQIILRDEIEHVAIGNRWFTHLCESRGFIPSAQFMKLQMDYRAPKLKPPFNIEARLRVGFNRAEIEQWSAL